jgi:anti-anti-sigma factor
MVMDSEVSIRYEQPSDGASRIVVAGEVDISNVHLLEATLEQAGEDGPITVDLRDCRYIDSSTIALLVRCCKKSRSIRVMTGSSGNVRRVLALTNVDQIIEVIEVNAEPTGS